jgi:hypothetical protein
VCDKIGQNSVGAKVALTAYHRGETKPKNLQKKRTISKKNRLIINKL